MEETPIVVLFNSPVKGIALNSGDLFTSDRHEVLATWAHANKDLTEFLNYESVIVASWSTNLIKSIQWPTGKVVPPTANSFSDRMEEIKAKYPNAWSKWSIEEDQQLIREFKSGFSIKECQIIHGRARGGIVSRLRKLELVKDEETL